VDGLAERIADKALPVLTEMGFDLADLELVKEGANWYLRFFIEFLSPDEPVRIEDCQRVSERLSVWLDELDPIPQAYFLEVSSPGIERPLKREKDFLRFRDCMVCVNTNVPVDGKKEHIGLLGEVSPDKLTIRLGDRDRVMLGDRDRVMDRTCISGIHLCWEDQKEG